MNLANAAIAGIAINVNVILEFQKKWFCIEVVHFHSGDSNSSELFSLVAFELLMSALGKDL